MKGYSINQTRYIDAQTGFAIYADQLSQFPNKIIIETKYWAKRIPVDRKTGEPVFLGPNELLAGKKNKSLVTKKAYYDSQWREVETRKPTTLTDKELEAAINQKKVIKYSALRNRESHKRQQGKIGKITTADFYSNLSRNDNSKEEGWTVPHPLSLSTSSITFFHSQHHANTPVNPEQPKQENNKKISLINKSDPLWKIDAFLIKGYKELGEINLFALKNKKRHHESDNKQLELIPSTKKRC